MEYFSINSFLLGTLFGICIYFSNLIFSLLCIFYNIKIIEFSLFYNPKFSLHKESIAGTNFTLGWMPLGAYIKPLGMIPDEDEISKISESDLPYAFFNKPKYLRTIFSLVPWFIYIFAFTIAFIWFANFTNLISELKNVINYLIEAISSMFSGGAKNENFVNLTKEISAGKNNVVFGFMLLTFTMILATPLTNIFNWLINEEKRKLKIEIVLGFIFTIGVLWLIFWKIPRFIFSFFTFSQSVIYILSFFIGMFSIGLTLFFTTLFIVKNISQNLNDNRK